MRAFVVIIDFMEQKRILKNILVTGGAGFIGANFIRYVFTETDFTGNVINVDALTYAGNLESLADIDEQFGKNGTVCKNRYFFEKADICDAKAIDGILSKYNVDTIVHFAAESHVDRSILGPDVFVRTNVVGTFTMLECAKKFWQQQDSSIKDGVLFHHISTDEVYGSLGETGYFTETTLYDPRSPYSASKASSDHMVMAYFHTYGLPITLSNCTNNYGPYQFPEKLIPLMILNMQQGKALPVYGDGKNIRDWIYVQDHNSGVWTIITKGKLGEKYNIGGENEWENIRLLDKLIEIVAEETGKDANAIRSTITHVKDRLGHDRRYAIDCTKIKTELGWQRKYSFEEGLRETVKWNLSHKEWINNIQTGAYARWLEDNYGKR